MHLAKFSVMKLWEYYPYNICKFMLYMTKVINWLDGTVKVFGSTLNLIGVLGNTAFFRKSEVYNLFYKRSA